MRQEDSHRGHKIYKSTSSNYNSQNIHRIQHQQLPKPRAENINMAQPSHSKVHIRLATFPDDKAIVGKLFLAYAQSLPISLDFQNFDGELSALPGKYAEEQGGAVWLAYATAEQESSTTSTSPSADGTSTPKEKEGNGEAIGCIALRPFNHPTTTAESAALLEKSSATRTTTCELKRLYLTPEARGTGVSKLLMDVAISQARKLGYKEMLLDTLRIMTAARRLYEGYGFEECGSYYENPNDVLFYRLAL
jgi:GNAT superfamily N-acetyltransferase